MCHLSYLQLLSCAHSYKYLEVLWLPKRTQLWACFNTEPNRLYRRLRLFPSKLQEYTPPPFSRLSAQYHIDPLLTCLLSLDTSRTSLRLQRSTTGILRMGDMNIHITWLTHVRTGPKKKKSRAGLVIDLRAVPITSVCHFLTPMTFSLGLKRRVLFSRLCGWVYVEGTMGESDV